MKRVYKSPATPERLCSYVKAFPDETWEHFRRRNRRGYREVKQQLLQDQHGLCAYCEISIKLAEFEDNVDDCLLYTSPMLMISGWSISSPK